MSQATVSDAPDYRVEPGFAFPAEEIVVTEAEQRRLHGFCDIPADRYGGFADPTFLARRPILLNTTAIQAYRPTCAPVHIVHRLKLQAPVPLGEALTMTGVITDVPEVPRGWVSESRWEYRRADGAPVLTVEPDVMMIDSERQPEKKDGPRKPKPPESDEGFETLTRKQCTPETTLGYCEGSTNLIHIDPDTAKSYGFRAPIIAGNQTVNFLLEALALDGLPQALDVEIRFRRPVFWDDALDIRGRRNGSDGSLSDIVAVNGDGARVATCAGASVTYSS